MLLRHIFRMASLMLCVNSRRQAVTRFSEADWPVGHTLSHVYLYPPIRRNKAAATKPLVFSSNPVSELFT